MSPLPMPVRIAAGLAAIAVEQVRDLPRLVVEFPVTAVSQALQASMRVQQKVTELAIKGDQALGAFSRPEEAPAWATFDDEDLPEPAASTEAVAPVEPVTNGHAKVTPITPTTEVVSPSPAAAIEEVAEHTLGAEADTPPAVLPEYPGMNLHQLRGKLRKLDLAGLQALLIWETSHENRPPFVTMLSNRITTVQEG
ncbi:lipid droplet-associated protein [Pseudonocardia pini]|uniref:lipid droplet-associated protein n=1 Tax=Pseudonocardia pini TaxID=2758030 RepID=UPI0015F02FA3|nr:lipid droplet-associated protein [Pseudonocardia pini]